VELSKPKWIEGLDVKMSDVLKKSVYGPVEEKVKVKMPDLIEEEPAELPFNACEITFEMDLSVWSN
jgi:hypothetical protein